MQIEQLDYDLPQELIAQYPAEPRDHSRLMLVNRASGRVLHYQFADLKRLVTSADCLVLNDTRVMPARLTGHRSSTGGRWEALFLREVMAPAGHFEMLVRAGGRLREGEVLTVHGHQAGVVLRQHCGMGHWLVEPQPALAASEFLARFGHVPLPPYIRSGVDEPGDCERYQTVYAERPGAVAAPTAGLHFTSALLNSLTSQGTAIVRLTLHVGLGTFLPIRESVESHVMHAEWGELTAEAVEQMSERRRAGGRTIAVGTTCVRVLETAAQQGELRPWCGETSIFIYPPFQFRAVDALVTNFHLPRTTLLALVYAFAGRELMRTAYAEAVRERYRFYSFGDAMLIV